MRRTGYTRFDVRQPAKGATATAARTIDKTGLILLEVAAWAVPGAAHLWLGRRQKGIVFIVVLPLMFLFGLAFQGRLFPFDMSEPLVALASVADFGLGVPFLLARLSGAGAGQVTAVTYEYGNAFLIVAGLLNFLIMLDAYDIALGRK